MDKFAQITFHEHGRDFRVAAPRLVQTRAIAYNMQQKVINYLRHIARNREMNYMVDVGACYGAFALPYLVMFPDADILCLEPAKTNYQFLEFNTKDIDNIEIRKIAANDEKGDLHIAGPTTLQRSEPEYDLDSGLISVYGESNRFSEIVPADTLDNIVTRPVDWLKIDVEGHEIPVLRGAERILREDRPILQIEIREENQLMARQTGAILLMTVVRYDYALSLIITGTT
jgi:FkbM family methyltransferase